MNAQDSNSNFPKDPPKEKLQLLLNLYNKGELQNSLAKAEVLLEEFPNSSILLNICGSSNHGLFKIDNAIKNYTKALKINPNYAEVYFNLGVAFKDKGHINKAIENYKKALIINPSYTDVHFNLGNSLKNINELNEAIYHYKKALELNPKHLNASINLGAALNKLGYSKDAIINYKTALNFRPKNPELLNNLGFALKDNGNLEDAIDSFEKALKINPKHYEAQSNLISLLSSYIPKKVSENKIVLTNNKIREISIPKISTTRISDDQILNFYSKSEGYLNRLPAKLSTKLSQVYRRNSTNLNCRRHMSIFNEYNVIPKFCFSCYKVQVEPRNLIDLLKLCLVFDRLNLKNNNTRKCMIELRPEISGFYKGLIYCSSIDESIDIKKNLNKILSKVISAELTSSIKRGCSEYPLSYPSYKEINFSGPQKMNYNKEWRRIEESNDILNPSYPKANIMSISGLNLNDILIMQKWIDYAKGIGDTSANALSSGSVYYKEVFNIAKKRVNLFN